METQLSTSGKTPTTQEHIAVAAYYLYAQNGFRDGRAEDDWREAEKMLSATAEVASEFSAPKTVRLENPMPGNRVKSKNKSNGTI